MKYCWLADLNNELWLVVYPYLNPNDDTALFTDSPDNLYGREEYAIMDTTLGGRWLDVQKKEAHPFVCKRYNNKCPRFVEVPGNTGP